MNEKTLLRYLLTILAILATSQRYVVREWWGWMNVAGRIVFVLLVVVFFSFALYVAFGPIVYEWAAYLNVNF